MAERTRRVAILGGGWVGLAAAWELKRLSPGDEIHLFEKEDSVGGLSKNVTKGPYVFAFGPHNYHPLRPQAQEFVHMLGQNQLIRRDFEAKIAFNGKYYRYPVGAGDMLRNMDAPTVLRAGRDYLESTARRYAGLSNDDSMESWVINRFGRTTYDTFFGPYTKKVWGVDPSQLSPVFAARRIPYPGLISMVRNSVGAAYRRLAKQAADPDTVIVEYFCPVDGPGVLVDRVRELLAEQGVVFHLGAQVRGIRREGNRARSVILAGGGAGGGRSPSPEDFDIVLSSIPLPELIAGMDPAPPEEVRKAAAGLRFRSLVVVGLAVNRPSVLPAQHLYSRVRRFNRVSELSNLHPGAAPKGQTVLTCELTCDVGDQVWNSSDEELARSMTKELAAEQLLLEDEILDFKVMRATHGYPIYLVGYQERLNTLRAFFGEFENLSTAGRQGALKYIDMDVAMECGFAWAQHVANGTPKSALKHLDAEYTPFF
jgi:protoporphyrinogen oxidase